MIEYPRRTIAAGVGPWLCLIAFSLVRAVFHGTNRRRGIPEAPAANGVVLPLPAGR